MIKCFFLKLAALHLSLYGGPHNSFLLGSTNKRKTLPFLQQTNKQKNKPKTNSLLYKSKHENPYIKGAILFLSSIFSSFDSSRVALHKSQGKNNSYFLHSPSLHPFSETSSFKPPPPPHSLSFRTTFFWLSALFKQMFGAAGGWGDPLINITRSREKEKLHFYIH